MSIITPEKPFVVLTRVYMTRRGALGVCYRVGGRTCASFVPRAARHIDQIAMWLSKTTGLPVRPAHTRLARVRAEVLVDVLGQMPASAQHSVLLGPRPESVSMLQFSGQDRIKARVASSTAPGVSYDVTLDTESGATGCTCRFGQYAPHKICQHAAQLAHLLVRHASTPDPEGFEQALVRPEALGAKMRSADVELLETRWGYVHVRGATGSGWVPATAFLARELRRRAPGEPLIVELSAPAASSLWTWLQGLIAPAQQAVMAA